MKLGSQEPRVLFAPSPRGFDESDGEDATRFAAAYRLNLDPYQALTCRTWMRRTRSGAWCADTWGVSVARQNGKNGGLEAVELYGMVVLGLKFLHTAHEVKTARKAFMRLLYFFENEREFPDLAAMVKEIRKTNGQEAIVLHSLDCARHAGCKCSGGSIEFVARSKGSGRGFTVDVLVLDEAQDLRDEELEALLPTISAAPSGDPATIYMGTPPKDDALVDEGKGAPFLRVRNSAVEGTAKRVAWVEFSLDVDLETMSDDEVLALVSDKANWYATNPALGRRINVSTIEGELEKFSPRSFARERLNVWPVPRSGAKARLDVARWASLSVPTSSPEWPLAAVGLDMDVAGRTWLAIGAHADEPVVHVELTPDDPLEGGVDAAVETLWRVCKRRRPVVLPADSGASVLVPALKAREMKVYLLAPSEMAQASMGLAQAMKDKTISHLDDAVLAQGVRESSGVGMKGSQWRLGRDGEQGGAPIQAVACARMGAVKWAKRRGAVPVGRSRQRVARTREAVPQ